MVRKMSAMRTSMVLASAMMALLPASAGARRQAPESFTVRTLCFTARARPGTPFDPLALPPLFAQLSNGLHVPLGDDPEAFIRKLGEMEPGFEFELRVAGNVTTDAAGAGVLEMAARRGDSNRFAARAEVFARRATPTQVRLRHVGRASWRDPVAGTDMQARWHRRYLAELGRTYTCEEIASTSGLVVVVVVSVQPVRR